MNERSYTEGSRRAWLTMLGECMRALGYDDPKVTHKRWILERESAVSTLREVCEDFGDNDWPENLHLSDVIDKHLARHLHDQHD